MIENEIKNNEPVIVKKCPYKLCNVNKDFFCGSVLTLLVGTGYWYFKCKDRSQ